MKVLLAFLFLTFLFGIRAANRNRPSRVWLLLIVTVAVAAGYITRRVI